MFNLIHEKFKVNNYTTLLLLVSGKNFYHNKLTYFGDDYIFCASISYFLANVLLL